MKKRLFSLALVLLMLLSLLAGCGTTDPVSTASETSTPSDSSAEAPQPPQSLEEPQSFSDSAPEETASSAEEPVTISYPLFDEAIELTIFGSASSQFLGSVDMALYANTSAVQELEAATGIRLDYSGMVSDDIYQEKLSLAVASGDYSDFLCKATSFYATGAEGLLAEEICIDIKPYLEEYAPDLKALIDSDPDYADNIYTASGNLVGISMRAAPTTDGGAIIRQDWLDALGMDVPGTFDELHEVLTAFKSEYGCTNAIAVLSTLATPLTFGFDITFDASSISFLARDGVVSSNLEQPGAREYVELLTQYYEEGLFNSDFLSNVNMMAFEQMATSNTTGFWMSGRMSFNGVFEQNFQDEGAKITPVKDITKTGTEVSNVGGIGTVVGKNNISITTQNEYPEESVSFINYLFTEKGIELANYGVEGETFVYENGTPVYTDMILANPDGYNSNVARSLYTLNAFLPYYQPQAALELTFTTPEMAQAEETWKSNRSTTASWSLNAAESEEYNALATSLNTYMQEQLTAFVVGQRDIAQWDSFLDELREMDLDRMTEIQQQAYDRKYGTNG